MAKTRAFDLLMTIFGLYCAEAPSKWEIEFLARTRDSLVDATEREWTFLQTLCHVAGGGIS